MLEAIDQASESVLLEVYIFAAGALGERFRDALVRARARGAKVCVLIDALGSYALPGVFWDPLRRGGGEVRVFNPLALNRLGIRNHRKLLVCDRRVAFIGGFNVAPEYEGDGVTRGWCDLGLKLEGGLVGELAVSFEEMFLRADFRHKRFIRLRKPVGRRRVEALTEQLLLTGPGRGRGPVKRAWNEDLCRAGSVRIIVPYFLPTWRLRRQLLRVAQRGGRVQLILPGKSDVLLSQLATRSLYRRLLRAGVEIFEYQPQILHAKLYIIGQAVYVGSANFDQRSLKINYELMIRIRDAHMAAQAEAVFARHLAQCKRITLEDWNKGRSLWRRIKQRWAYFVLVRIDPYLAHRQWQALPD